MFVPMYLQDMHTYIYAVNIYEYVCMCIHTYIHTYIHIYIHTYTHTDLHTYICGSTVLDF